MDKFELLQKLRELDEVALIELLEVDSTEIVDAFLDRISLMHDILHDRLQEED